MCTLPDYKVRFFLGVQGSQSLVITLPKKGNLQQCQNYRAISLISDPSKIMLKITLTRLKPQAKKIIAKEQAGFRAGRNITDQIFNLRTFCDKYLQHLQDLYHILIVFMKTFNRDLACSFGGNHEEVQHQGQPYPSHQTPLWQVGLAQPSYSVCFQISRGILLLFLELRSAWCTGRGDEVEEDLGQHTFWFHAEIGEIIILILTKEFRNTRRVSRT